MEDYIEVIPEIIKAASASSLGILALIIVVFSILAYGFFRKEGPKVKLFVFLVLFSGSALFVNQMYNAEPVMAAIVSDEDDSTTSENKTYSDAPEPPSSPSPKAETKPTNKPSRVAKESIKQKMSNKAGEAVSRSLSKTKSSFKTASKTIIGQKTKKTSKSKPVAIVSKTPHTLICKHVWTPWQKPSSKINNVCAPGCVPEKKLSKGFRITGFPPKPEVKYKLKCSKASRK